MSGCAVWRVEALATPAWQRACATCSIASARFEATSRFRANAHQGRLDVWLLYACSRCGATEKRRLLHRTPVRDVEPARLDGYHRNDPALARAHAFELPVREPLAHRVVRPPLPASGVLVARIEQPEPCGVRWDALLARELGWSRARVEAARSGGAISVAASARRARIVADGDVVRIALA